MTEFYVNGKQTNEFLFKLIIKVLEEKGIEHEVKSGDYPKYRNKRHEVIYDEDLYVKHHKTNEDIQKSFNYLGQTVSEWVDTHDKALKETDNAIEPKHYREGQIDLIESWYLRYPFNEFKTGMVMYADRYFNRSKNNRVEDMEKGLYVMQRLKEYEEKEKEKEND